MASSNDKLTGFLTGLLAGGIAGAAIALLYAPSSGKVLRRKIGRTTEEMLDDINEYYESGLSKAEELFHDGKKKASNIIDDAKKIINR